MSDETIIEKAIALLPGGRSTKKRASAAATRNKQLGAIQKKLAALAKNVEKLAGQIKTDGKKAVGKPTSKKRAGRKAPARKPATRKPARRVAKRPG